MSRNAAWSRGPSSSTRRTAGVLSGLLAAAVTVHAVADPVLHEYIELGAGEDLGQPAVTGAAPTEIAPSPSSAAEPSANSDGTEGAAPGASALRMDADTTRPERVAYEDPFTPTIVPYKRGVAYDAVNRDGDLIVSDTRINPVGTQLAPRPYDEHFAASLTLELEANEPTSIPSVAPGARLVVAHANPPIELRIGSDSAENWYVYSNQSGQVGLTLQLRADRRVFGSQFREASWPELARELPVVPDNVKSAALEVAQTLGVARQRTPRAAVTSLVEHFRRFKASTRRPASRGLLLYRDLALTARGICRHRAYAFMITALGLGIPTRYVMNEAHAWVEVFDGELWHRIDLGGAAAELSASDDARPRHVEPHDPFAWQDPSESGHALASRRAETPGAPEPGAAPTSETAEPAAAATADQEGPPSEPAPPQQAFDTSAPGGATPSDLEPPPAAAPPAPPTGPEQTVLLRAPRPRAERGKTLQVAGQVRLGARSCRGSSVDVRLMTSAGPVALGTLITDDLGKFEGSLVVPWDAPLGEHRLEAAASGTCAAP